MADELLVHAAGHGHLEEAALLLERRRANAAASMPPSNTTALHAACRAGDLDMVELLLRFRANPNAKEISPCGGRSSLHVAAGSDNIGIAGLLLKADADTAAQDARGLTPLHTASQEGGCDTVRLLMAHGADPHVRDFSGHNAAYWAKEFKHTTVLDFFVKMQVPPRAITATQMVMHGKMCRDFLRSQSPVKKTKDAAAKPEAKKEGKRAKSGTRKSVK